MLRPFTAVLPVHWICWACVLLSRMDRTQLSYFMLPQAGFCLVGCLWQMGQARKG